MADPMASNHSSEAERRALAGATMGAFNLGHVDLSEWAETSQERGVWTVRCYRCGQWGIFS